MHPFALAALGGLLMGAACAALLLLNGRILGISGVLGGALKVRSSEAQWRWAFVAGMLIAGAIVFAAMPAAFENTLNRSMATHLIAGGLVGIGTQLGSGCTSGHGICGIGRLSKRSIAATITFMATGAATVVLVRQLFPGVVS